MNPLFLDFIDPQLFISSLTTNNISSLRGQVGAFTVSSIIGQNISSIAGQVRNLTTSSIVANNISSISGQVGSLAVSTIRVGTQANSTITFFSQNNTPYYSNSVSSFSLVGELLNVYYVAKNGSDSNSGSATLPFQTITRALTFANNTFNNTAIYVSPGVYTENLTLSSKNVTIIGIDSPPSAITNSSTTIIGNHTYASPSGTDSCNIHWTCFKK
jgi:hypothetical protein